MRKTKKDDNFEILKSGKVFLLLPLCKYHHRIFIGRCNYKKKTFYTSYKRQKDIYRYYNSVSISYELLNHNILKFLYICCNLEGKRLWASVRAILKYGIILHYEYQGIETQITLPLDKWHKTKKEARLERIKIKKERRIVK